MIAIFLTLAGFALAAEQVKIPEFTALVHEGLLELRPPAGHHFNTKAPNHLSAAGSELPSVVAPAKISARFPTGLLGTSAEVTAYVCDNSESYCVKQARSVVLTPGDAPADVSSSDEPARVKAAASGSTNPENGFLMNDGAAALELAASSGKPLMLYFYGIWCPPCNHLDAMVLKSARFKKATGAKFVRVALDSDDPASASLRVRYHLQFLPTIVFATPQGEEIFRTVGFHPIDEMLAKAKEALSSRDAGFDKLVAKARAGDDAARLRAAELALDRGEPELATELVGPLRAKLAPKAPGRETIDHADAANAVAKGDHAAAVKAYRAWLDEFPDGARAAESWSELADELDKAGDAPGSKDAATRGAALIERLVADSAALPAKLVGTDFTRADLLELLGELYGNAGDDTRAKDAYLRGAEAYAEEGRAEKSAFARGPSLERAYCLGKAGKTAESEAIYREGIRRFPEEYTFHKGLAKLFMSDAAKAKDARAELELALRYAYGNQRLKAVLDLSQVLEKSGEVPAAIRAIDTELAAQPEGEAPASTAKLREMLKERKAQLAKK
jgi:thiol-disulfide isomerase/thioredoxin